MSFLPLLRLDKLRSIVPHPDRANTAAFLDEVINHVLTLQKKVQDLEAARGKAVATESSKDSPTSQAVSKSNRKRVASEESDEDPPAKKATSE